jgi:hypothetical protein
MRVAESYASAFFYCSMPADRKRPRRDGAVVVNGESNICSTLVR